MKRTVIFEKENNTSWYIVLPEWTGDKGDLLMVAGADTLLDILSNNSNDVEVTFSNESFDDSYVLKMKNETPDIGGALYNLEIYDNQKIDLDVWLCGVTEFVFGNMPKEIYFK